MTHVGLMPIINWSIATKPKTRKSRREWNK